jgi:hypothetical protein
MPNYTIKHGSEAGYREELKTGEACERCRNGHREFSKQYNKTYKAKGIKYGIYDVVDQNYVPRGRGGVNRGRSGQAYSVPRAATTPVEPREETPPEPVQTDPEPGPQPGLGDRIGALLGGLNVGGDSEYVSEDPPDYLHFTEADPEPDGDWEQVANEEFVINAAGMRKIEDSLGTYLSIIGMTVEMVDPYCGPIIAMNMGNMVERWSKVIAHYPKAANLFLDQKGGVLMTWIGAMQATWPVLYAIYEHHLSKTVKVENGQMFRRNAASQNGQGHFDSTMPPMPDDFNYTVN